MYVFYNDSKSILVVNPVGKIRRLYTPFRVLQIENQSWLYVEEVLPGEKDEIVFIINGYPYPHSLFQIQIKF